LIARPCIFVSRLFLLHVQQRMFGGYAVTARQVLPVTTFQRFP
jgi:hypothetical protein